jgi:hypothetical protein
MKLHIAALRIEGVRWLRKKRYPHAILRSAAVKEM